MLFVVGRQWIGGVTSRAVPDWMIPGERQQLLLADGCLACAAESGSDEKTVGKAVLKKQGSVSRPL
jgi:hypothetical protein